MRGRNIWLAGLLAAGLTLAPAPARAQEAGPVPDLELARDLFTVRAQTPDGELPDFEVPVPLGQIGRAHV